VGNKTITAQMSEREVNLLDRIVSDGYYCSRSDAVRAFVRDGIVKTMREGIVNE